MKLKRTICGFPFEVETGPQVYCVNRLCSETPVRGNREGHCVHHARQHQADAAAAGSDSESDVSDDDNGTIRMHDPAEEAAMGLFEKSIIADNAPMADPSNIKAGTGGVASRGGNGVCMASNIGSRDGQAPISTKSYGTRCVTRSESIKDCEPIQIYSMRPKPADISKQEYLVQWFGHTFLDASWESPAFISKTAKGAELLRKYQKEHSMGNFYSSLKPEEVSKQPVLSPEETAAIPTHWVSSGKRRRASDADHPGAALKKGRRSAIAASSAAVTSEGAPSSCPDVDAPQNFNGQPSGHTTSTSNIARVQSHTAQTPTYGGTQTCSASQPTAAWARSSINPVNSDPSISMGQIPDPHVPSSVQAQHHVTAAVPTNSSMEIDMEQCVEDNQQETLPDAVPLLPTSAADAGAGRSASEHKSTAAKKSKRKKSRKSHRDQPASNKPKFTFTPCSARKHGKMEEQARKRRYRSSGVVCMYCICGHMCPPVELVGFESVSEIHKYLMRVWDGHSFNTARTAGCPFIIGYDDACHLLPFSRNPCRVNDDSPTLVKELARDVRMVVDKFHFNKNHPGENCAANCSPHALPELDHANTEVAKQNFKNLAEFKKVFRYMNKARFNFMLMLVCKLTRELREKE